MEANTFSRVIGSVVVHARVNAAGDGLEASAISTDRAALEEVARVLGAEFWAVGPVSTEHDRVLRGLVTDKWACGLPIQSDLYYSVSATKSFKRF